MKKIDQMMKEYNQAEAGKADLEHEIKQLQLDQQALDAEAEAAAKKGDVTLYREKKDAARQAADMLFVRQKQLEGLNCLRTDKEAREAWKEYAEAYNKDFLKAWAAYEKARERLYADFMDILNGQNEALKIRAKCAACCGTDPSANLDRIFAMKLIPDKIDRRTIPGQPLLDTPDTNFFLQAGLAKADMITPFNKAIRLHQPY